MRVSEEKLSLRVEYYSTSNNRNVHVSVTIDKNVDSILKRLVIQQQCRYVLEHYSCKFHHLTLI